MRSWGLGNFFSSLAVPVGLQKRLLSFLLQRAIGHFLEDDLDLEKLDIELSNGIVHLTDLKLNTRALNELAAGTPLAVTMGCIGSITATIPWRNLWNGQCVLEIDGIDITLAPIDSQAAAAGDHQDQHLSSSMDLASDFLHQASGHDEVALQESLLQTLQTHATQAPSGMPGDFNSRPASRPTQANQASSPSSTTTTMAEDELASDGEEGVQFVAKLIEKLMARIQVICRGTTIRLRHSSSLPLIKSQTEGSSEERRDYEVEIQLPYIAYRDETPGWDQSAANMDASSVRSSSGGQGSESVPGSTLEESIMPSVIWHESSESSIKMVIFKGFSVWIKQKGQNNTPMTQLYTNLKTAPSVTTSIPPDDHQESDSDTDDVFSDAQENLSQSVMAPQMTPRVHVPPLRHSGGMTTTASQEVSQEPYAAEILSTLQHKNRVKINIRKNASIVTGSSQSQAQTTTIKSLLDIDFHIRSILIALSPNQIAFIMEILALMTTEPINYDHQGKQAYAAEDATGYYGDYQDMSAHHSNFGDASMIHHEHEGREPQSDHLTSIGHHSPLSPKRSQPVDSMKVSQPRSLGSRPLDIDRHVEVRNPRAMTPTPAAFLDSSRFLNESIYTENRPTNTAPSVGVTASIEPSQTVKLKARISAFQMFILYQDPESQQNVPTEANFFKNPIPEALSIGHLKLELDSMLLRYQQWASAAPSSSGQKSVKSNKGQIDFTLNHFRIAEWIQAAPKAFDTAGWSVESDDYRVPLRRQYIPLVEFDAEHDSTLQTSPTSKFPVVQVPDRYLSERTLLLRSKKSKRQTDTLKPAAASALGTEPNTANKDFSTGAAKEVIRVRVLLNTKKDGSRPATPMADTATATAGYARDVTVEVKPLQVHLDVFTLQRLEQCLIAIMSPKRMDSTSSADPQRPSGNRTESDPDATQLSTKAKTRLRLRLNSVQLWVSIPRMDLVLAGKEDTGPEFKSLYEMLCVNISKMVLSQSSESVRGMETPGSGGFRQSDARSPRTKVEFAGLSVFVVPKFQTSSRAIVYIGSLMNHPASLSGFSNSLPSLEVITQVPGALPARYVPPSPAGYPRTPALQAFAILEGEENVHNTADEEEELLLFQQHIMDSSLLVVDVRLPLVAVHMHKSELDNLQLRANDLGTWATIFSEQLVAKIPLATPSSVTHAAVFDTALAARNDLSKDEHADSLDGSLKDEGRVNLDDGVRDDHSEHGTDRSTAFGEELRQQAEGSPLGMRGRAHHDSRYQFKSAKPTMATALISAQTVEVILDYPTKPTVFGDEGVKSYQINVSDAKVFAGAKYQGSPDTYVSIDAEELELWEVTAQKPKALLLTRTIPKTVKLKSPKPMFHMTSMLSFDPVIKFKENDTNLAFTGISWKFSVDQTAVDDVQDFFVEPANIVYYDPPRQRTRVGVSLVECCMDYKPLHIPPRFVLSFEKMKVFSTLIPESPTLRSKVQIYNMALFLIDHTQSIQSPQHPTVGTAGPGIDSRQFWRSLGFAMVGQCRFFELKSIKSKIGQLPLYDLAMTNNIFYLETCSDSFETLMQLAAYMSENGDMPFEKKRILERLAEAERASNRAKSNVIYQDVLASLDEDAFRKPSLDPELDNTGTIDLTEGFFSVERADSENDLFKAQLRDTPNVDGFHEVYADLLVGTQSADNGKPAETGHRSSGKHEGKGKKSKSRGHAPVSVKADKEVDDQMQALGITTQVHSSSRTSLEGVRRNEPVRQGAHTRKESQLDDIVRVLELDYELILDENHFSIPVLTEEEKAQEEGSLAKLRLRVRDFDFSWRLYDGFDWEISRLDEAERKRQARQLANRLYDPNDAIHATMDSAQSNLEASIFERLSGVQASPSGRHDAPYRRDLSAASSEADSTSDYQNDIISQAGGMGGRSRSTSSATGHRRAAHPQHQHKGSSGSHHDGSNRKKKLLLERSKTAMIEFNAEKVRVDFEDCIPGIETASRLSLRVRQFEIIDNLKSSLWHKFLSHQRPDTHTATPRLTQSNMIRIDLDGVRPVLNASTVEHRLRIRILPLRLYIDQDALVFLIKFFVQSNSNAATIPSEDLLREDKGVSPGAAEKKKSSEMYFQSVKMGEISVKVDYKPKHVDYTGLTGGNFVELMNFFHLDAAEMTLQEVRLHGINGFAKLGQDLVAAWLPHIRSTQVPHMVSGLTPIRSLVNLGSGIADLVLLPIEQYKRDGHIIRGLQKGGQAFTRATTLEALKIGTKLAVGTQVLLEHADEIFGSAKASGPPGASIASSVNRDVHGLHGGIGEEPDDGSELYGSKRVVATMVSDSEAYMQESIDDEDQLLQHLHYQQQQQHLQQQQLACQGSSSSSSSSSSPAMVGPTGTLSKLNKISKYANQPADINEGMELAYKSLSKNIETAAHTIFAVPMEVYERTGAQGSVRAVIRAVPVAVLKPMIGATEAFSKVLIGLRNSIDPVQRLEMEDKYKRQ